MADFEAAFAGYCGRKHAVGTSSGTSALRLALQACGVAATREVITVPNTFIATAEAISQVGARPVFVDIDPLTGNMDPSLIKEAVNDRTAAIVPVHLYGLPCDMAAIQSIGRKNGVPIVEDACQAHGAEYEVGGKWVKVGAGGAAACMSFYPTKNLGAFGEGGVVVTDSDEVAEVVTMLRDHGQRTKNVHEVEGSNERLHSLQAAFLSMKLELLDAWNGERRRLAHKYSELLSGLPVATPKPRAGSRHVYHLYVVRAERRDELRDFLSSRGVGTGVHYPMPIHLQPAYGYLGHKAGDFPLSEKWAEQALSLPLFVGMREEEVEYVVTCIRQFFG